MFSPDVKWLCQVFCLVCSCAGHQAEASGQAGRRPPRGRPGATGAVGHARLVLNPVSLFLADLGLDGAKLAPLPLRSQWVYIPEVRHGPHLDCV